MTVILIVDDVKADRDALADLARGQGHTALTASDAVEAVNLLSKRPDVALMDLIMPGIDGLEAMKAIKAVLPTIRVIAITGAKYRTFDPLKAAVELGADGALTKPVSAEQLAAEIARVMAASAG